MKEKLKKVFKNRIFICILTALITGTISVYAVTYFPSNQVTYDNTTSGLKSSDVQGAIDELYNTCSSAVQAGDYIYFTVGGGASSIIYRVDINGSNLQLLYIVQAGDINNLYVVNDYIYFTVTGGTFSFINRIDINGQNVQQIYSQRGYNIGGMFVTNDYIYFTLTGGTVSFLQRINLDGTNVIEIYRINSDINTIFIK